MLFIALGYVVRERGWRGKSKCEKVDSIKALIGYEGRRRKRRKGRESKEISWILIQEV
jgi:hypothetical protein